MRLISRAKQILCGTHVIQLNWFAQDLDYSLLVLAVHFKDFTRSIRSLPMLINRALPPSSDHIQLLKVLRKAIHTELHLVELSGNPEFHSADASFPITSRMSTCPVQAEDQFQASLKSVQTLDRPTRPRLIRGKTYSPINFQSAFSPYTDSSTSVGENSGRRTSRSNCFDSSFSVRCHIFG